MNHQKQLGMPGWLVVWVLWHINLCRLFNTKSIFMLIIAGVHSPGQPEGSLFNSYYTEVYGRALLLSLDCSTLPLIHTLYCWVLSKEVSSTIFKVFGMTRPGIEARSPEPLANILPTRPMGWLQIICSISNNSV